MGLELDFARAQTWQAQKAEVGLGRKQQSPDNKEKGPQEQRRAGNVLVWKHDGCGGQDHAERDWLQGSKGNIETAKRVDSSKGHGARLSLQGRGQDS